MHIKKKEIFSTFTFCLKEISIVAKFLHFTAVPSILQIKKKISAFPFTMFAEQN